MSRKNCSLLDNLSKEIGKAKQTIQNNDGESSSSISSPVAAVASCSSSSSGSSSVTGTATDSLNDEVRYDSKYFKMGEIFFLNAFQSEVNQTVRQVEAA